MKACRCCKIEKPLSDFVRNAAFKNKVDTICLACNRVRVKDWRKANPEKRALQMKREGAQDYTKNKHLRYSYGITLTDYNTMLEQQQECCAICKRHESLFKRRLHVDHDHNTGKVRQLLCIDCNHLLGRAKDNINILLASIDYLNRHK